MRPADFILCIFTVLFSNLVKLTVASTDVSVDFYTGSECSIPSALTPNASIPLNVCVNTPGLISFHATGVACPSGNLEIWVYLDPTCGSAYRYLYPDKCWSPNSGNGVAAPAVGCGGYQPKVTTTTTYSVGDVITQAPTSGATATDAGTTTQNAATPTNTSSGGTSNTNTQTDSGSGSGWSSLSYAERIGIIVALATGIPGIIIALVTLRVTMRKR